MYVTKKGLIYATLKDEIYEGKYKFGEKLIISHLAKRFSSSEIPVREAMNQLESEGLIEFKPHVGAIVSPLSAKDIRNIMELRIELEGLATRLAVEHFNDVDLEELRRILDDSLQAIKDNDYELYYKLNVDFHMKIYKKCDNQLLIKTIEDLWNNANRYPSLFNKNDEYIHISNREHEDIYQAIQRKDAALAENIILKHKARAAKEILRVTQRNFYNQLNTEEASL